MRTFKNAFLPLRLPVPPTPDAIFHVFPSMQKRHSQGPSLHTQLRPSFCPAIKPVLEHDVVLLGIAEIPWPISTEGKGRIAGRFHPQTEACGLFEPQGPLLEFPPHPSPEGFSCPDVAGLDAEDCERSLPPV